MPVSICCVVDESHCNFGELLTRVQIRVLNCPVTPDERAAQLQAAPLLPHLPVPMTKEKRGAENGIQPQATEEETQIDAEKC